MNILQYCERRLQPDRNCATMHSHFPYSSTTFKVTKLLQCATLHLAYCCISSLQLPTASAHPALTLKSLHVAGPLESMPQRIKGEQQKGPAPSGKFPHLRFLEGHTLGRP